MALVLSGTDNSVSSPAVQGGTAGTTTGVYYPATNQLGLATNGSLALVADASQNIGISKSAPVARLHIAGSGTSGQVTSSLILENTSSGTLGLDITGSAGSSVARFRYGGGPGTGTNSMTGTFMTVGLEGGSAGTQGIYFAPTQSASSDANTLDDYEEGTWTPGLSASGYTFAYGTRSGNYTKIGNTVYVKAYFTTNATPTGSGTVTGNITGLPFTSSNNASSYGAWSIAPESGSAFFSRTCAVRGYPSSTQVVIFNGWGGSSVQTSFNWSTIGSFEWEISGFYFID